MIINGWFLNNIDMNLYHRLLSQQEQNDQKKNGQEEPLNILPAINQHGKKLQDYINSVQRGNRKNISSDDMPSKEMWSEIFEIADSKAGKLQFFVVMITGCSNLLNNKYYNFLLT